MANEENERLVKRQAAQQKINKIALEYFESKAEQRIALQQKIIDKVLLYIAGMYDLSAGDKSILFEKMAKMEERSEKTSKPNEYFNAEVICRTVIYCLESYNPSNGDFMNLFNFSYKKRNTAAYADEKNRKYLKGFSQSQRERDMIRGMNKLVETLGREDERFAGKKAYDLSADEIDEILSHNHIELSFKERGKMIEILRSYSDITNNTSSFDEAEEMNIQAEDNGNDSTDEADGNDIAYEIDDNEDNSISMLFKAVFDRANKNQKRYFSCFTVQDLVSSETIEIKNFLLLYIDKEFFSMAEAEAGKGKITNKMIAVFLGVKEPAVSKKRSDYERLLAEEKSRLKPAE